MDILLLFLLLLCNMPVVLNCIIVTFCTKFIKGQPDEHYQTITNEAWYFNKWVQLVSLISLFITFYWFAYMWMEITPPIKEYIPVQEKLYQRI